MAKQKKPPAYQLSLSEYLDKVKRNLILQHSQDDETVEQLFLRAVGIAERRQNRELGYYQTNPMPPSTEQAVIMLASHLYESRDGSTAGFFGDSPAAGERALETIYDLLRLDKEWRV